MQTQIILTITHTKPINDLTDKVAGRAWSLDGVTYAEAKLAESYTDQALKFMDETCGVSAAAKHFGKNQ